MSIMSRFVCNTVFGLLCSLLLIH